jgi:hypothetical protein
MKIWNHWVSFWSAKEDGFALAGFRIAIGLTLLYTFGMPFIDGAIEAVWIDQKFGGMRNFNNPPWLISLLGGANPTVIYGIVWTAIISATLLILGVFPRLAAFTGMIILNNIAWHNNHAGGGHDDLVANALWLLVFAESNATLSITCRLRTGKWTSDKLVSSWPRQLALLQLLLMYTSTGWQKLSAHWVPFGEYSALWYILQQPTWARMTVDWLAPYAWTTKVTTIIVWWFEVGAPLLLLALYYEGTPHKKGRLRKWSNAIQFRKIFMTIGITMHIGIQLLMVVGPFSFASLAYYFTIRKPPKLSMQNKEE